MGQEGIEEADLTSSPLAVRGYEIVKVQGVSLYEGLQAGRPYFLTNPPFGGIMYHYDVEFPPPPLS